MPEASNRPQKGERYEVTEAFTANVLTMWKAPFTGGYEKQLPSGLRFAIIYEPPPSATAVSADAEPYLEWEKVLVENEDRNHPKYNGYYLIIPFDRLASFCTKLR
jgi:hypothetical protein